MAQFHFSGYKTEKKQYIFNIAGCGRLMADGDYWGLMEDLKYPLIPINPH